MQHSACRALAWGSPGAERRETAQLARFQLARIKKLEGSLQMHFLLSSLHPRTTFPGGAGGGEAGSRPLRRTWAGILMPEQLPSAAGRSDGGSAGPGRILLLSSPRQGRIRGSRQGPPKS
eukprot:bmy_05876T0